MTGVSQLLTVVTRLKALRCAKPVVNRLKPLFSFSQIGIVHTQSQTTRTADKTTNNELIT